LQVGACREALASLLSQEVSALAELVGLLDREHALLVANDVEALETAMEARQVSVGKLLSAEEERRSLCRARSGTDAVGVEQLMAWCDPAAR
jgi:flagellar biosynthesis/type III secretory pathway chaperone